MLIKQRELAIQVVGFNLKTAYICGALRTELETIGMPLSLADLQIAAIAIANDLVLISGNLQHFNRIPHLKAENWL